MSKRTGIVSEFFMFIKENKAYWLAPIIIVILLMAGIIVLGGLGGGAAAPFIYSLF
jgi:hypothetical protein